MCERVTVAEARCSHCGKLLGYDVVAARFVCPRCKAETRIEAAKK